ncbi:MAG: hypothetical protein LC797_18890, partial [Chloroflexi bacterium]|nr:hypothetical protein [Chloroflexota bacterium]
VLGGFRSLWGPVVGALMAQGLAEMLRFSAELRLIVFAVLVLVIMRVYPPGVVGLVRVLASGRQVTLGNRGSGGKREQHRATPAV